MAKTKERKWEECPHCGAQFRAGRPACPECGSDAETGWRSEEDVDYLSVEIPDTYEEFTGERRGLSPFSVVVLVLVILGMALWTLL